MGDRRPLVSVIIPALRVDDGLEGALQSIAHQDYNGPIEAVVAMPAPLPPARDGVTFVANPTRTTPAGLNAAFDASSGEVIVRCDVHSRLSSDYVRTAVETLQATGAWNVGGMQAATGDTPVARAIAVAQSTPLGVGDARYRLGGEPGEVDTVYLGTWPRGVLEQLGGFSEDLERNQDYELNVRIRRAGGIVWFDPRLVVDYTPRSSLRRLARQYHDYGRWKRVVAGRHRGSLRWRQVVPPALVIALFGSSVLLVGGMTRIGVIAPTLYGATLVAASVTETMRHRDPAVLLLGPVLATMHVSWGLGFLRGHPASRR